MKTLYLDIFSGISGDMFIGALLDLGVDFEHLRREIDKLGLEGFHLHADRRQKANIAGVKFDVRPNSSYIRNRDAEHSPPAGGSSGQRHDRHRHSHPHTHEHTHAGGLVHSHAHSHEHEHDPAHEGEHAHEHAHEHGESRNFGDIQQLIVRSTLSTWVKEKAVAVFRRVAIAEGKIHGLPPEKVHFHEVGAVDSIVDIVGACVCLEQLGLPRVTASTVTEGHGWVECAHGRFPVPTAATLEILGARGIPVTQCEEPQELVTPTGAALLAEFVEEFGPMRGLVATRIGYGLGTRDNRTRPNVLRAVLGQVSEASRHDWEIDTITVLETNLDDSTGELLGAFIEKALQRGALDVFHTPIQMKKNRPGVLLSVLCPDQLADAMAELILRETTAFGLRRYSAERRKLRREVVRVATPFGEVSVKVGRLDGKVVQQAPEFESCREVASKAGVTLREVYDAALRAART